MKRRLSVLLAIILMLTVPVSANGFADVQGQPCEKAVEVLRALGIAEGRTETEFAPGESLTRAEAVTFVLRLMGIAETGAAVPGFEDVAEDHFAYRNIGLAQQMGIVNGITETQFAPDAPVTYPQAVKMLVNTLGYSVQAEASGGYPAGYLAKANQLGLLSATNSSAEITRGTMAILMYNALDIPLLEKTNYGTEAYSYGSDDGNTILSRYLHIEKISGKVTADYLTVTGSAGIRVGRDEVAIDGEVMQAGTSGTADYLLRQVEAYVREENGEKTILIAVPKSASTAVVIESSQIANGKTADEFIYEADGRENRVSVAGADIIVNGQPSGSLVIPETGTVTLIYSGADVESVLVWRYTNYVVDKADEETDKVYFKKEYNGVKSYELDTESTSVRTVLCDADGKDIPISALKEWGILSVAESADKSVLRAIYSDASIAGEITEIGEDTAVIGGSVHKLAKELAAISPTAPELGLRAAFYKSFSGEIAAIDAAYAEGGAMYAYLVAAANGKGLGGVPQMKLYTENGEMKTYYTADTVILDGRGVPATQLLPESGNVLFSGGKAVRQLLKVKINIADLISEIDTAADYLSDTENDAKYSEFSKDYYIDENRRTNDDADGLYVAGIGTFSSRFLARGVTKIFAIPDENATDKEYSTMKYTELIHFTSGVQYRCTSLYDVDEGNVIGAIVWEKDRGNAGAAGGGLPIEEDTIAVIASKSIGLSEDGETLHYLTLRDEDNKVIRASVDDELEVFYKHAHTNTDTDPNCVGGVRPDVVPVSALDVGDVVQYEVNSANKITMLNTLFRHKTPGEYDQAWQTYGTWYEYLSKGTNYAGLASGYATVEYVGEYGIVVQVGRKDAPGETWERTYPKYGLYLLFERDKNLLSVIEYEDIREGDKVYNVKKSTVQELNVVYR